MRSRKTRCRCSFLGFVSCIMTLVLMVSAKLAFAISYIFNFHHIIQWCVCVLTVVHQASRPGATHQASGGHCHRHVTAQRPAAQSDVSSPAGARWRRQLHLPLPFLLRLHIRPGKPLVPPPTHPTPTHRTIHHQQPPQSFKSCLDYQSFPFAFYLYLLE